MLVGQDMISFYQNKTLHTLPVPSRAVIFQIEISVSAQSGYTLVA
jgi:hypothetical protein